LVLPLDASSFESCPCSLSPLASHVTLNFLQSYACPLHVVLMKVDERASNGACMINLN
jgi:hypothetical protein